MSTTTALAALATTLQVLAVVAGAIDDPRPRSSAQPCSVIIPDPLCVFVCRVVAFPELATDIEPLFLSGLS